MDQRSEQLEARNRALIAEIRQAFATTKLGRGLSWSQTVQLDHYEPEQAVRAGRHSEPPHWLALVDDAEWHPFPGIGGYSFIDAEGFRFYLPPTMIRMLRKSCEWYPGHLVGIINRFVGDEPESLLSQVQCRCVAKFMEHMSDIESDELRRWAVENPWGGIPPDYEEDHWRMALDSFWNRYLSPS